MSLNRLALFTFLILGGCATSGTISIHELNISLNELQKIVIDNTPIKVRRQSSNGREFYSEYFIEKKGQYVEAINAPVRMTAALFLLGDRRPYTIEIKVLVESRGSGASYSVVKHDEGIARVISRRIEKTLYQRREDRNIIDDFRVF